MLRESKTLFYQSFANHRVPISLDRAIISITFDDVPRSAFINAVPILDRYDIKSTFYVSTGLTEENDRIAQNGGDMFLYPKDIIALHRSGHDIACHTYSHYRLDDGNADELYDDAEKNIANLTKILGAVPIEHFSYPFGQVNFKAKRLLAQKYKSMRSSRPGLNRAMSDLYFLRATSLYNPGFSKSSISKLIRQAEQSRGWLILYTHGVEEKPGAFSCTPEQFEWVVQQCVSSSADVMPINTAYDRALIP